MFKFNWFSISTIYLSYFGIIASDILYMLLYGIIPIIGVSLIISTHEILIILFSILSILTTLIPIGLGLLGLYII